MERRGPPKKPTRLKEIAGTAQPCRINRDEPRPEGPLGVAPERLKGEARRHWDWLFGCAP